MISKAMPRKVRVTTIAERRLTPTPNERVNANPLTKLAPNVEPNQKRIALVIKVARFESRMDGQARFQPRSIACCKVRPFLSSSLRRSNIRIFASSALPVLNRKPAIPGKVKVTGMNLKRAYVCSTENRQYRARLRLQV